MTEDAQKKQHEKSGLHLRNKHRKRYDFDALIQTNPKLAHFVKLNTYQDYSIDFSNQDAVKALNQALLKKHYAIDHWNIPANYLCPAIPGRADYLHYIADLLASTNDNTIPLGGNVFGLDIGVGANAIYPLIGHREYGWHFVGSDISQASIANAQHIIDNNAGLSTAIELRFQKTPLAIFDGMLKTYEKFDFTICNPPFHASLNEAHAGTRRKWQNLNKDTFSKRQARTKAPSLNFGGQSNELHCEGGEETFVNSMMYESKQFMNNCLWFTSLISKATNLPRIYRTLKKLGALEIKTIEMTQGQKKSRIVAWTFLTTQQQSEWCSRYS
jgi:23S rRNA (adenine1618-N6)-methyltransferase